MCHPAQPESHHWCAEEANTQKAQLNVHVKNLLPDNKIENKKIVVVNAILFLCNYIHEGLLFSFSEAQ